MDALEECLAAVDIVLRALDAGNTNGMSRVLDDVLREAAKLDSPEAREIEVVAHFGASRLSAALKQDDERVRNLAKASALARKLGDASCTLESVNRTADALMAMGENQLAIRYCNQAVALTRRSAAAATYRLWRAGRCYLRAGFPDDARAPLREAVDRWRTAEMSVLLPSALLDLGNACLESDPVQAESCYREAAEMWAAAGKTNLAASAWSNVGLLCSRAARFDEALAWFEKVRASRAADPVATVTQRGNIHNNIASLWRRKGELERARTEIERAIDILTPEGGAPLAHAYGSFGEICRDGERHEDAVVWFQRAREVFERQPSPNVSQLVTKLENEATALERVGRDSEAADARARIAHLKVLSAPPGPTIPADLPAKAPGVDEEEAEACVIVSLDGVGLPDDIYESFDLATLEQRLERKLEETNSGDLDGHESGPETTRLFFYGRDARKLFDAISPLLRDYPLCRGARIELRQGAEKTEFPLEG